jgi:mRNA-degrading endonuclease RelE of RelBE toxin-antitoxin system
MRRVRLSKTFFQQLHTLLEQGYPKFGERVVLEKRDLVFRLIEQHLARYPRVPRDPSHGLCVYPVRKTPFALVYDYDDAELRVLFIFHKHADLSDLDPGMVEW